MAPVLSHDAVSQSPFIPPSSSPPMTSPSPSSRASLFTAIVSALSILSDAFPVLSRQQSCKAANAIQWSSCGEGVPENLQCANFTVPLDWRVIDGDDITLALARIPAKDASNRIGSLFVNPGGPGGSGIDLVTRMATGKYHVGEAVLNCFDIVSMDPRGIGQSTPVICDADVWNERVSLFPKTKEEYQKLVDKNKRAGLSCREKTGRLIDFVDTASVARDHEAVRIASGDEEFNWLGLSYGTQIGSQYAELFPNKIRSMVLDGNVQRQSESSNLLIESTTYEVELTRFFAWCAGNSTCPFYQQNIAQIWEDLLAKAAREPIPALGCNNTVCRSTVWPEDILFGVQPHFTNVANRPALAQALYEATQGNATTLSPALVSNDDPVGSSPLYAGLAIECQDWTHATMSFGWLNDKMNAAKIFAPYTRGATQSWTIQTQCIGWPAPLTNPPREIHVDASAPTILMVNAFYDPETSYVWATGLRDEIGNAVLLSRDGDGHTSNGLGGETANAIDAFLLDGRLPAPGTVLKS